MPIGRDDQVKIVSTVMSFLKDRDYGYVVTDGLAMRLHGLAGSSALEEVTFIQPPGSRSISDEERRTLFGSLEKQGVFHKESIFFKQREMAYEPVVARDKRTGVDVPVVAVGDLVWGKVDHIAAGRGDRNDYVQLAELYGNLGGGTFDTVLASHPVRTNLDGLRDTRVFPKINAQLALTSMTDRSARLYADSDAAQARMAEAQQAQQKSLTSWLPSSRQEKKDAEQHEEINSMRREARRSLNSLRSAAKSRKGFDAPGRLRALEHPGNEPPLDASWRRMAEQVRINLSVVRPRPASNWAARQAIAQAARASSSTRSPAVRFSETPAPSRSGSAEAPKIPKKVGQSRRPPGR